MRSSRTWEALVFLWRVRGVSKDEGRAPAQRKGGAGGDLMIELYSHHGLKKLKERGIIK
jgi:hypothetical protein